MPIKLFNKGKSKIQYGAARDGKGKFAEIAPNQTASVDDREAKKLLRLYPEQLTDLGASGEDTALESEKIASDRAILEAEKKAFEDYAKKQNKNLSDAEAAIKKASEQHGEKEAELHAERTKLAEEKAAFEKEKKENQGDKKKEKSS